MANEAYKLKADASIPQAIRPVEELPDGTVEYETIGRNYAAGAYVLADEISPPLREMAENGDLDHLLESVSLDEAQEARSQVETRVLIAEHEAEREVFNGAGAVVVPREQVLELASAGADAAAQAQEEAKADDADERPSLTAPETPQVNHEQSAIPEGQDAVDEELLEGVQRPPGLPVGRELAEVRGGGDNDGGQREEPRRRGRPRKEEADAKREQAQAQREHRESQTQAQ